MLGWSFAIVFYLLGCSIIMQEKNFHRMVPSILAGLAWPITAILCLVVSLKSLIIMRRKNG